jgi:heptosyltransferase-2
MKIDKPRVKKILLITLSNIGDVILTLPVLYILKREFDSPDITVICSKSTKELFEPDISVNNIIVYDKHMPFMKKLKLAMSLRRRGFDLVVDLKNTMFPLLVSARYNTPYNISYASSMHCRDKHLRKLSLLGIDTGNAEFSVDITRDDKIHVNSLLNSLGILPDDSIVAVSAGAKSHTKRWKKSGFVKLCEGLADKAKAKVLLIGDEADKAINESIYKEGIKDVYDLTGRTNLRELLYLLSVCRLLVTNDSAPLHAASAVSTPAVAIFGPTDHNKYGPLAQGSIVIRKDLACAPCQKALCRLQMQCMNNIEPEDVLKAALKIINKGKDTHEKK